MLTDHLPVTLGVILSVLPFFSNIGDTCIESCRFRVGSILHGFGFAIQIDIKAGIWTFCATVSISRQR